MRLLLWTSREDSCVQFEIDSSRVPEKWLLLELKKTSELEDSMSMGQENIIFPERLLLLTSRRFRYLLHSKDWGRFPVSALPDKSIIEIWGRIWPISAGMEPSRWLFDSIRPWSCTNGTDQIGRAHV